MARLRSASRGKLGIPEVFHVDSRELHLEPILHGSFDQTGWIILAEGLAQVHQNHAERYGLDESNYIGLNPQPNDSNDSWGRFFVSQRLEFQISLISDDSLREVLNTRLSRCSSSLAHFLDCESGKPTLVHGDLWRGNVLCDASNRPWLIDPAVYFGDPETDIAMTEMFGGFNPAFYDAYWDCHPPSAEYATKREIYQLYHYLNHYNLFGDAYLPACLHGFKVVEQVCSGQPI